MVKLRYTTPRSVKLDWIASQLNQEQVKVWLSVGWTVYIVVVSIWILMQRSQPVATLSWLLSMAALPVVGLVVYYYFGPQRMRRQRIKRLRSLKRSKVRASIQRLKERMPKEDLRVHQVARLVASTSDFPVSTARNMQLLNSGGGPLCVSVNLSTRDLLDQDFPDKLEDLMRKHGVATESFCLEITESAIMDDPDRAEATLNRLSQRGFKLSIDDFGTGYSSLAYLKRLPVNELKIDKSFVMGMDGDESDSLIVKSTIELAHNLGKTVVAEGVENQVITDKLRALSCDEAQGYHLSRPLPLEQFNAWRLKFSETAVVQTAPTYQI